MATNKYDNRILAVEVTGLRQPAVMTASCYTFKVPYNSLAQTLRFIGNQGGQVVRITVLSSTDLAQEPLQVSSVPDVIEAPLLSPSPQVDFEAASPFEAATDSPEVEIEAGELTQPSLVPEVGEPTSTSLVESEIPEPPKLQGLVRRLMERLKQPNEPHADADT